MSPASHWRRDAGVVLRALVFHPELWMAGLGAARRLARRGWWRRAPYLPLPGEEYWSFRMATAYGTSASGGADVGGELTPGDVVSFLRWCRRTRPRRG